MISKEEVKRIAKLARLELTDNEVEKMQKDLSEILDYFNLLKKAPKTKIKKFSSAKDSALRKDEIISSYDIVDKLIALVPNKKDSYIKVKTIL